MSDMNAMHLRCRGKAAHGWVEGYYLPDSPLQRWIGPVIFTVDKHGAMDGVYFSVDPESVNACSGLEAKGGKLIYDQDIVVNYETKEAGLVDYSEADGMFGLMMKDGTLKHFSELLSTDFEIVGNSFDNDEYLEFI